MTALTIQDVSRRSGLSEPTLRYYEEVGLIGPITRDPSSGHRRYCEEDLDALQALACLRAMGVGIEEMRTYQANRELGHARAGEQRDLLLPYPRSKAIAERAAWDFIGTEGGDTQLVVVNPTFIAGPSLVAALRSTLTYFKAIVEGTMPALPRQRFGVADVRDVADAHMTAMATPPAAGKRYLLLADGPTITWLGLAQVLHGHLGPAGEHVTTTEAPGEDPSPLTIHNDRAKQELRWRPRSAETTITETADSLRDLGLLE